MGYTPPWLNVTKIAGGMSINPGGVTTDDLVIYANPIDTKPLIHLLGNNGITCMVASGYSFKISDGTTDALFITRVTTETRITSVINDNDLCLYTTGAGVLRFGSYTAGAATDSTGYISIKDAAGTARKLMVQA
jgi:hypothetical protein